jgi:hypothetical protein
MTQSLTQIQFEFAMLCQNARIEELKKFDFSLLLETDAYFGIHVCIQNSMITMKKKMTVVDAICRQCPNVLKDDSDSDFQTLKSLYYRLDTLNGLTKLLLSLSPQRRTAFVHFGDLGNDRITKYIMSYYYLEINSYPEEVYAVFQRSIEKSAENNVSGMGFFNIFDFIVNNFRHHFSIYDGVHYTHNRVFYVYRACQDRRVKTILTHLFPYLLNETRVTMISTRSTNTESYPYETILRPFVSEENCVICYDVSDVQTPCEHNLCRKCLPKLRTKSDLCPMCRQPFHFINVNTL